VVRPTPQRAAASDTDNDFRDPAIRLNTPNYSALKITIAREDKHGWTFVSLKNILPQSKQID